MATAAAAAHFPPDLIPEIARRLTSLEDFFALRASCRAYRALLPLTASNLASQAPLLVLYREATESYVLFNLTLRRCLRFRFPVPRFTDGQSTFVPLYSLGCRVAVEDHVNKELGILHPFTGEEACLPSPPEDFAFVALSGDLALAWGYFDRTIQYCRLRGADWRVASIGGGYCLEDLIFVNGTIYVLVTSGNSISPVYRLAVAELSDDADSVELVFLGGQWDAGAWHMPGTLYFCLAQCCGELILLGAEESDDPAYHLFQWNSEEAKWERITSLGGCTLFFTANYFVGCLGPDHPGIARNCIYLTHDKGHWSEYSSVDGCFRPSDPVDDLGLGEQLKGFSAFGYWVFPSMC